MHRLAFMGSFIVFATASVACSAPDANTAETDVSTAEVNEGAGRPALPEEVRIIVQKDASSPKMCLVYEQAFGKLKASQCTVGGEMKVGSDRCELGGDGCWRVGRMEAWRAIQSGTAVELIHLDAAHLTAKPGDAATITATQAQQSLLALVDGHLTTPMSGSRSTHEPPSEWCATLEQNGGDVVLGLKKFHSANGSTGPKDYTGCATITLERAQQVWGPLPTGMRAGDDCSATALRNLAIADGAPDGATACTQANLVCVEGKWAEKSCAQLASSSRSFCSNKGFCDASMTFPAEGAPCANPKDSDALSCGKVLGAAGTPSVELTCQDGFWKTQSCAAYASSSRSHCAPSGRCDSLGH